MVPGQFAKLRLAFNKCYASSNLAASANLIHNTMSTTDELFMDKKLKEFDAKVQSILDELKTKDELIATLYENIKVLEELDDIKNRMIIQLKHSSDDYKKFLEESVAQTTRALEIGNTMLETRQENFYHNT